MVGRVVQRVLEELRGQEMCVGRCGVAEEAGSGLYVEKGSPRELEGSGRCKRRCPSLLSPYEGAWRGRRRRGALLLLYPGYLPFASLVDPLQAGRAAGVPGVMLSKAVGALVSYRLLRLVLGETSVRLVVAAANAANRQSGATGLVVPKAVASEAPQWLGSVGT